MSDSGDKTIKIWDISTRSIIEKLTGHNGYVASFYELKNVNYISASADSSIKIWDMKTKTCIDTLIGHSGNVM